MVFPVGCDWSIEEKSSQGIVDKRVDHTFEFIRDIKENKNQEKIMENYLIYELRFWEQTEKDIIIIKDLIEEFGFPTKEYVETQFNNDDLHVTVYFDEDIEGRIRPKLETRYRNFQENRLIQYIFIHEAAKIPPPLEPDSF